MTQPVISELFLNRQPSVIRVAQIEYSKRTDNVTAVNTAIGNVSLPMHPAMVHRMKNLDAKDSPFSGGVVKYTSSQGTLETRNAILNVIKASGASIDGLYAQITDGGSAAMELVLAGVCGPAGADKSPLLSIDATYTNYSTLAQRIGRKIVSVTRSLDDSGKFALPDLAEIEDTIQREKPTALLVIPYDNPTGHFYTQETLDELAELCVKYNLWMVSDEAYRELFYVEAKHTSSVWNIDVKKLPGISGRRISIETASKVWNACGLRIGALVTDNQLFHEKSVAEYTANLCANAIGQYIFGSLANETVEDLNDWFIAQRQYYSELLSGVTTKLKENMPELIVSSPDASIYSVVDVRNMVGPDFHALDFVMYCATKGMVNIDGQPLTLLVSPMRGFYKEAAKAEYMGRTQMRIAYVESPQKMDLVPVLFTKLLQQYLAN